jgi:hypothetical protein
LQLLLIELSFMLLILLLLLLLLVVVGASLVRLQLLKTRLCQLPAICLPSVLHVRQIAVSCREHCTLVPKMLHTAQLQSLLLLLITRNRISASDH